MPIDCKSLFRHFAPKKGPLQSMKVQLRESVRDATTSEVPTRLEDAEVEIEPSIVSEAPNSKNSCDVVAPEKGPLRHSTQGVQGGVRTAHLQSFRRSSSHLLSSTGDEHTCQEEALDECIGAQPPLQATIHLAAPNIDVHQVMPLTKNPKEVSSNTPF